MLPATEATHQSRTSRWAEGPPTRTPRQGACWGASASRLGEIFPKPQKPQKDEWSPQRPLAPPPWPSHLLWLQHRRGLGGRNRSELLGVGRSGQIPQAPLGAVPVLAGLRDWAPGPPGTATDPPPPGPALCPFPAHLAWGLRGVHRKRGRWAGQGTWRLKGAGVSLGLPGQLPPERCGSGLPPIH